QVPLERRVVARVDLVVAGLHVHDLVEHQDVGVADDPAPAEYPRLLLRLLGGLERAVLGAARLAALAGAEVLLLGPRLHGSPIEGASAPPRSRTQAFSERP